MKLNLKNSQYNNQMFHNRNAALDETVLKKHKKINNVNVNIELNQDRPAQAISFGGSAGLLTQKFVKSGTMNRLVEFVKENEVAYNAVCALVLAGVLKPMCVLNMPGSEDKDKQIVATKNFLQAFIGYFMAATVGGKFVKKSYDVIKNNYELIKVDEIAGKAKLSLISGAQEKAEKIVKKDLISENTRLIDRIKAGYTAAKAKDGSIFEKGKEFFAGYRKYVPNISQEQIAKRGKQFLERLQKQHIPILEKNTSFVSELLKSAKDKHSDVTLMDAFETTWKNSSGWITAILKAKVSSWLLPGVMAFLFAKRNSEKQQKMNSAQNIQIQRNDSTLLVSNNFKKEQEQFKSFLNKNSNSNVSFKGISLDKPINVLAMGVEHIAMSKPGEKFATGLTKLPGPFKKPAARMADLESLIITGYWLNNTQRSKKIDPDQKLGLNVHTALVTAISSTAAFFIDWFLDGKIKNAEEFYEQTILQTAQNAAKEVDPEQFIRENCKKLFNADEIAKTLMSDGNLLKDDALKNAALGLGKNYKRSLNKFKSLTIFTIVVRFLIPILMVPVSGKLKKKINSMVKEHNLKKEQNLQSKQNIKK